MQELVVELRLLLDAVGVILLEGGVVVAGYRGSGSRVCSWPLPSRRPAVSGYLGYIGLGHGALLRMGIGQMLDRKAP